MISISITKLFQMWKKLEKIIKKKEKKDWDFNDGPYIKYDNIRTSLAMIKSEKYKIKYINGKIDLEPFEEIKIKYKNKNKKIKN
jgi:hypothetical protein